MFQGHSAPLNAAIRAPASARSWRDWLTSYDIGPGQEVIMPVIICLYSRHEAVFAILVAFIYFLMYYFNLKNTWWSCQEGVDQFWSESSCCEMTHFFSSTALTPYQMHPWLRLQVAMWTHCSGMCVYKCDELNVNDTLGGSHICLLYIYAGSTFWFVILVFLLRLSGSSLAVLTALKTDQ